MIKAFCFLLAVLIGLTAALAACTAVTLGHSKVAHESAKTYISDNEDKFVADIADYLATQHFTLNQIGAPALREIARNALEDGEIYPQLSPGGYPPFNSLKISRGPWWRLGPGWSVETSTSLIFSVPDPNPDNPSPRFQTRLYHNIIVETETGKILSVTPHDTKRYVWVSYSPGNKPTWYVAHNR